MKETFDYVLCIVTLVVGAAAWVAINAKITVEDKETGCQYIYNNGCITPRLDSAGKPMCGKKDK